MTITVLIETSYGVPPNQSLWQCCKVGFYPFLQGRKLKPDQGSHLPKTTQLVSGDAETLADSSGSVTLTTH